jgi:hypothetical protein
MDPLLQEFLRRNSHPFGQGAILPPIGMPSGGQVKDIDSIQGIVTMYWSAFGNVDAYEEVIDQGAFKKTIAEWGPKGKGRIAHLLNHNPTHRVGVVKELSEDNHGLLAVSKILGQNHSKGRDALIEYEEGAIREHSIGFRVMKWERDDEAKVMHLVEIKLYEGSGVTWGANPETPVVDVKALQDDPLLFENMINQVRSIERCLKRGITDERAIELEDELNSFKRIVTGLDMALRAEYKLGGDGEIYTPRRLGEPESGRGPEGADTPASTRQRALEPPGSDVIGHAKAILEALRSPGAVA